MTRSSAQSTSRNGRTWLQARTWLIRVGSFALAGLLLWLALRGADWAAVGGALRSANYWWVPPVIVVTIGAHWLRAVRWCIMMDVLPERRTQAAAPANPPPTSRPVAFASLLVGYMANYAGPRIGELIRAGNVAAHERLSFSSLMGTVVAERVLDVLTLALGLATLPIIYGPELSGVVDRLAESTSGVSDGAWWIIGAAALTASLAGLYILFRRPSDGSSRLGGMLDTFRDGLVAVTRTGRSGAIVGLTAAIWLCYTFMAWVPLAMLGYTSAFGISPFEAWGLMIIGSFGVVLPAPGGIGTYHVITVEALGLLHAMPASEAATYALLTHTGQMIIYVVAGFAALTWLGPRLAQRAARHGSAASLVLLFAAFLVGGGFSAGTAHAQAAPAQDSTAAIAAAHVLQAPLQADLLPGLDITYVRAAIVLLPAERRIRGSVSYHVTRRAGADRAFEGAASPRADSLILRAGAVAVQRVQIRPLKSDVAADSSLAPPPPAWTHRADTLRIGLPAAAHPPESGANREPDVFVVQIDYETARVGYDVRDRSGWKAVWTPSRPDAAHWFPHPLAWSDPFSADVRVKTPPGWSVHFPAGYSTRLPGPDHAVHVWQPAGEHLAHGLGFLAMDVDAVLEREDELAAAAQSAIATEIFRLPAGHPSHYWPGLVLVSDDMTLETDPLMGRFQAFTDAERVWAAPLATATYWTDSWLHEAAVAWRALEALGASEGAAARQRVLEEARRRYLAEPYRRPLVWDRWQSPFDLEDAHARWKGLWVLEMLAGRTSSTAVHAALSALRAEALLAPVDTEDFRLALESASELTSFLDTWIYSAGHPRLSVIHSHDAAAERLTVIVEQTQEGPFIPPAFELEGQLVISSIGGSEAFAFRATERSARSAQNMPVRPRYVQFRSNQPLLMEFDPPPDEMDVTAWIRDSESDAERVALLATLADGAPDASLLISLRPVLEAAPDHVRVAAFPVLAAMAPSESALRLVESIAVSANRNAAGQNAAGLDAAGNIASPPLPDLLFARMGALEAFSTDRAAALALETANTSQNGFLLERAVRLLVDYREDMAWQVLQSALVTDSERDRIRRLAIRLIEASGRGARERLAALLPLTENPHHPVTRGEALLAAARIDPTSATVRRRTAAWLPDERPALRAAAIEALDVLPEGAVPTAAIIDALERETRPALRRALLSVLLNRDA